MHLRIIVIETLLVLKKCLPWKLFILQNHLHWIIICIGKITFIEKNVSMKKLFSLKKLFHIQNVTFKIVFGTWCKLMYENFPFPLEKNMKILYNKG